MGIELVKVDRIKEAELESLALQRKNFRINQVFVCQICDSQTNLATVDANGIDVCCPNLSEKWHSILAQKTYRLNESGHPKSYTREIRDEIKKIKEEHPMEADIKGRVVTSPKKMDSWDKTSIYSYPDPW